MSIMFHFSIVKFLPLLSAVVFVSLDIFVPFLILSHVLLFLPHLALPLLTPSLDFFSSVLSAMFSLSFCLFLGLFSDFLLLLLFDVRR